MPKKKHFPVLVVVQDGYKPAEGNGFDAVQAALEHFDIPSWIEELKPKTIGIVTGKTALAHLGQGNLSTDVLKGFKELTFASSIAKDSFLAGLKWASAQMKGSTEYQILDEATRAKVVEAKKAQLISKNEVAA